MSALDLLLQLSAFVVPALLTSTAAATAKLRDRRRRSWNAELADVYGLEKPNFRVAVTRTFYRPTRDSIAVRPQLRVDAVEGNPASVERFEEAIRQTNEELLRSEVARTDSEITELFTVRLTSALGLEFSVPTEPLRFSKRTIQQALRSGGLSLLSAGEWHPRGYVRTPSYGGLGVLNKRGDQ